MSYDTILAKSDSIIYQPGGTASGITVTTWAAVQQFIALREGAVTVIVDDSITSPAPVPGTSGTTECFGRVTILPWRIDAVDYSVLEIEDGATLSNLYCVENMELRCGSQSVPSLTFSGTTTGGFLLLYDAALTQATTSTQPGIAVPAGHNFFILMDLVSFITGAGFTDITVPLVSVGAGAFLFISCLNNSAVFANLASGGASATFDLLFDNESLFETDSNGIFPTMPAFTGTYLHTVNQLLPVTVEMTFTATATNVLAAFQSGGLLPLTGNVNIDVEGFGGTGGGAGGSGGLSSGGPNLAGGGSGAATYQKASILANLADPLTVGIGGGGVGGTGSAGSSGLPGGDGGPGTPTTFVDATTNVTLAAFQASTQGSGTGHGGATYPGAFLPNSTDLVAGYGAGFVGGGGKGGLASVNGTPGQNNQLALLVPGGDTWPGGDGGTGSAGEGGGGGGGGAGIFAPGGFGGNSAPAGSPGGNGSGVAPNSGGGAGGGAGGASNTDAGGNGGTGSTGWAKMNFLSQVTGS
jgi:hypothetical protein